MIISKWTKAK